MAIVSDVQKALGDLLKKAEPPQGTAWSTSKDTWEYVTVPAKDLLGKPHPGGAINDFRFGPGKHFVPAEVASTMNSILAKLQDECLRTIRPDAHMDSMAQMASRGFSNNILEEVAAA